MRYAPLREEFENLSAVVRKLAAKVMCISGTPITAGVKPVPQPEVEALLARETRAQRCP